MHGYGHDDGGWQEEDDQVGRTGLPEEGHQHSLLVAGWVDDILGGGGELGNWTACEYWAGRIAWCHWSWCGRAEGSEIRDGRVRSNGMFEQQGWKLFVSTDGRRFGYREYVFVAEIYGHTIQRFSNI